MSTKTTPGAATKTRRPPTGTCRCGCGTAVVGTWVPGHDRQAQQVLLEDAYGTSSVAQAVDVWADAHPGTIHERWQQRQQARSGVRQAQAIVRRRATPSPKRATDELIAERRREARRTERGGSTPPP